ncbi:MAG: DUF5777 family beta-barrel protein [Bacteroidia bacterium]|nr:DUF5777 family beta-barrel protein [Bacteroidia bacterium]MDW8133743.1 DUF5777 family beta-barrel protein [Bacteroidia bacterium]
MSKLLWIALVGLSWAQEEKPEPVIGTFKGTRLYNLHTTELPAAKHLEFRVAHRFGDLRQGYANFFGIDAGANVRLSLGYGILPNLEIGMERTGTGKWWDAYFKFRPLRQKSPKGTPISLTWISWIFLTEQKDEVRYPKWVYRLEYLHQLLIARKLNRWFSAMIGGALLHQNMALTHKALNTWYWGLGGMRIKIGAHYTLIAEGAYPLWGNAFHEGEKSPLPGYRLPWSLGGEIETAGHVFQIGIASAAGLSENQLLLTQIPILTFGFNISRMFSFFNISSNAWTR